MTVDPPPGHGTDAPGGVGIVALLAPAVGHLSVDALSGAVSRDDRGATMSATDAAALEVALVLGETWNVPVTAVSVGGHLAESVLRDALAVGVSRAVRVDADDTVEPPEVAAAVANLLGSSGSAPPRLFVVAGVHGTDIASAAVPAYLAHHLAAEQALGLIAVEPGAPGRCEVVRRLDRGARERLAVSAPAVISVEGSVATLRRAGLRSLLETDGAVVETVSGDVAAASVAPHRVARPWRPRTRVVEGPEGDSALERIKDLTGVAGPTKQSRTVEADPTEAAELILDELGQWGYGPRAEPGD